MLTIDFDRRLPVRPAERVLDLGCGAGRHAFELYRRGADVVALDQDTAELAGVSAMFDAMAKEGQVPVGASAKTVEGDALDLPFGDGEFDVVVASEILEHIPDDRVAMAELVRVCRPGGRVAVSVPAELPERVCWALSAPYHLVDGGHVRIYQRRELVRKLQAAGLVLEGQHRAHALHSPYWWLKCATGLEDDNVAVRQYHRLLVWDMMSAPRLTRTAERLLDPVLGKSLVLYLRKPEEGSRGA